MDSYCTIRVKWNGGQPEDEQVARPNTFDDLVILLKQVRDRHSDEYAEWRIKEREAGNPPCPDILGGFGVEVTNRWGSVVEVGPGRDVWFLFRHEPQPGVCYSDQPAIDGTRVFYLDGGHHTELGCDMLVSQEECLRVLRGWLDTGTFPAGKRAEPDTADVTMNVKLRLRDDGR